MQKIESHNAEAVAESVEKMLEGVAGLVEDSTPDGNCFQMSFHAMTALCEKFGGAIRATVAHAEVVGQGELEGVKHWHAWVEIDDGTSCAAIDFSNGKRCIMDKSAYRGIARVQDVKTYTYEEVIEYALEFGHYGPWGIDEEDALLVAYRNALRRLDNYFGKLADDAERYRHAGLSAHADEHLDLALQRATDAVDREYLGDAATPEKLGVVVQHWIDSWEDEF